MKRKQNTVRTQKRASKCFASRVNLILEIALKLMKMRKEQQDLFFVNDVYFDKHLQ